MAFGFPPTMEPRSSEGVWGVGTEPRKVYTLCFRLLLCLSFRSLDGRLMRHRSCLTLFIECSPLRSKTSICLHRLAKKYMLPKKLSTSEDRTLDTSNKNYLTLVFPQMLNFICSDLCFPRNI